MSARFRTATLAVAAVVILSIVWLGSGLGSAHIRLAFVDIIESVAAVAAAAACWWSATRADARVRLAWTLLGASAASWATGQTAWTIYELVLGSEVPFPSVADIGYLAAIPFATAAILAFPSAAPHVRSKVKTLLDSLIVSSALLFAGWVLVLGPVYRAGSGSVIEQVIGLAYPSGDMLILATVFFTLPRVGTGLRVPLSMLGCGYLAFIASDVAFAFQNLGNTYSSGHVTDVGWLAGWLLIGLAAFGSSEWRSTLKTNTSRMNAFVPYAIVMGALLVTPIEWARTNGFGTFLFWNGLLLVLLVFSRHLVTILDEIDLTRDREAEAASTRALSASEARFRALVQNSSDVVTVLDVGLTIQYQNPSVADAFGFQYGELVGSVASDWIHPNDRTIFDSAILDVIGRPGSVARFECRVGHRDGSWGRSEMKVNNLLHDENINGIVLSTRDVSERWALEEQLTHNAFHDPLTNLANRALFSDRVQSAIDGRSGSNGPAVLVIDIDDFKATNEAFGHDTGDAILLEVAGRLARSAAPSDTVARLAGNEFAILIEDATKGQTLDIARSIHTALAAPIRTDRQSITVSASIGISLCAEANAEAELLLRNADVAMFTAKSFGIGLTRVFEDDMYDEIVRRLERQAALNLAIERREFVVHYQPIVEIRSGRIAGFEALVRWQTLDGLLTPADFIQLAEQTGQIVDIGRFVLGEATAQAQMWQQHFGRPIYVSVNLSPRQLQDPELSSHVARALMRTGLPPENLVLEITESVLMENVEWTFNRLRDLKGLGVRLAIDDFGVGYSSLSYLQHFHVDILKIDRSFVRAMLNSPEDSALLRTMVDIGRTFKLGVIAEGIEERAETTSLARLGCKLGQGYYYCRPLTSQAAATLLGSGSALPVDRHSVELLPA